MMFELIESCSQADVVDTEDGDGILGVILRQWHPANAAEARQFVREAVLADDAILTAMEMAEDLEGSDQLTLFELSRALRHRPWDMLSWWQVEADEGAPTRRPPTVQEGRA
jgi:hypothetical protein